MVKFDEKELLSIAQLSSLRLDEQEAKTFVPHITQILEYMEQLKNAKLIDGEKVTKNINVLREDKTIIFDSAPIVALAPHIEEQYFVVPKVLDV